MAVEHHPITSREAWLKLRERDVTASVAGCLLGVHDYQTPFGLWALKSGKAKEEIETSNAMQRGLLLEPVALKLYQMEKPDVRIEWNGTPGELGGIYYRDPLANIGATIDATAEDSHGKGIVQFKTAEASTFRRKWYVSESDNEDSPKQLQVPLWIAVQAIIEASLAEAQWAQVAVMVIGFGIEMHVIDVPIHQGVIDSVRVKVADFWRRVKENRPPDADYARDGETISWLYRGESGRTIDLRSDNRLPAVLQLRDEQMAIMKNAKATLETCKAEIADKIGDAAVAMVQGYTVTRKIVHRKAYEVKNTSYPMITVKKDKD